MDYMKKKSHISSNPLLQYCRTYSSPLHPLQEELIKRTVELPTSVMLGSADELQLLQIMCRAMGAKKAIDVGLYTSYSAFTIALALPDDGKVISCDITDEFFTKVNAAELWEKAGMKKKLDLRLGSASDTLQKLLDDGQANTFDFAFIDANKTGYKTYYELCLQLLRPSGILALDNMLWGERVIDDQIQDESTRCIRDMSKIISTDKRVNAVLLDVGDGTTVCIKL